MSAKREDHAADMRAADTAQALADASAARTWPISVHLTPFAPGCERLRIDDSRRWRTFYGRTVDQVLRSTLTRSRPNRSTRSASASAAASGPPVESA